MSDTKFYDQFVQIDVGPNHACGITSEHKLYSWGNNSVHNRLGLKHKDKDMKYMYPAEMMAINELIEDMRTAKDPDIDGATISSSSSEQSEDEESSGEEEAKASDVHL